MRQPHDARCARIRDFLSERAYAVEPRLMHDGYFAVRGELDRLRAEVKAMGYWAPHLPPNMGGMGLSLSEFAHLSEEMGQTPLGHYLFNCQAPDIGNMELLLEHGSAEQRERWLAPLAEGEIRSCFAMTEPGHAGSNPVELSTTAELDGDVYRIDGHKWFTSSADGAAFAIVMAKTDPHAGKAHHRFSQIIVPLDTPGFEIVRNIPIMGEAGEGYYSHSEVRFSDCRVPRTNLLGETGSGFALAQERLGPGRIHHCMRWIGICERVFDMMCRRVSERELSPGSPLAEKQVVRHWIAENAVQIHAARLMVLDAAAQIDQHGTRASRQAISMIKFFVADVLMKVIDRAIQAHGALGITDDLLLSYWYRHERGARIYDGPDEVHKSVVARQILKRYAPQ